MVPSGGENSFLIGKEVPGECNNVCPLDLAVRVFPSLTRETNQSRNLSGYPEDMLVFDAETRTDETQHLTFGSFRFYEKGMATREGLFHADDLPAGDVAVLKRYVETHSADVADRRYRKLYLLTRSEFVISFYEYAYKGHCLVVGFNLPFDLSRIACDFTQARGRFAGGFSLGLWAYEDDNGDERSNKYRPRIAIKHIDSKRALKGFTARRDPDASDLIPEDSEDGNPISGYKFRGHFLDLRTLAFALTDRSHSLESACKAFGVEHGKQKASVHGVVTEEYIDYNRRDTLATAELATKLLAEFDKHPIELQPTKAYSPASIGKAYLRAMGIRPILEKQPDFPPEYLGYAQSAFFGGRTSAHIRKQAVPVVYTDFLSMYPTVNSLMKLWPLVIAERIDVIPHCEDEIRAYLEEITTEKLFVPETWSHLKAFVKVIPDGDILPTRAKYSTSNDWQVAVNYFYAGEHETSKSCWFSLPDVVASVLLTGKIPQIVDAFRIGASGVQSGLTETKLYGEVEIDPATDDVFKRVIEERKRHKRRTDLSKENRERLDKTLKVLANSTSYGIYAEMNREESDKPQTVECHGVDSQPFSCRVAHPDVPGQYCFPPMAALITGAARMMLALLECSVTALGGTYAMEDTDSMAIVATEKGGLVECAGGPYRTDNGSAAVEALSWEQVDEISTRFAALNPYDPQIIPGSVLKIEDDNYDPSTKKQRQLHCYAISAKRYTLFLLDEKDSPVLLKAGVNNDTDRLSQHGLGHLLNPTNLDDVDRKWIGQAWLNIVRKHLGFRTTGLAFGKIPAIGRVSATSPFMMRAFSGYNKGKHYPAQIKPFNFILSCQIQPFGHPLDANPERFHLIAPYNPDPSKWPAMEWIDQYSGNHYRITTDGFHAQGDVARVKAYNDVLLEYEHHPESKCADENGNPCSKQTVGILSRRHVQIGRIRYIGKESNSLEDVEAGMVHSPENAYTEYPDSSRDEWEVEILPKLRELPLIQLVKETELSRRTLIDLRAGKSRPHPKNLEKIVEAIKTLGGSESDQRSSNQLGEVPAPVRSRLSA